MPASERSNLVSARLPSGDQAEASRTERLAVHDPFDVPLIVSLPRSELLLRLWGRYRIVGRLEQERGQ